MGGWSLTVTEPPPGRLARLPCPKAAPDGRVADRYPGGPSSGVPAQSFAWPSPGAPDPAVDSNTSDAHWRAARPHGRRTAGRQNEWAAAPDPGDRATCSIWVPNSVSRNAILPVARVPIVSRSADQLHWFRLAPTLRSDMSLWRREFPSRAH